MSRTRITTAVVVLGGLAACTVESPELPSFEAEWRLPLGEIEETVAELIEGEDAFLVGADGTLSITVDGSVDGEGVGDRLEVDIGGVSTRASLGAVELGAVGPVDYGFRLGELYPDAETFAGLSVPVPEFSFSTSSPAEDLPGFTAATLRSGSLIVTLDNGLPFALGAPAPPHRIEVTLVDASTLAPFETIVVPDAIAASSQWQRTIDLAGRVVPDSFRVGIRGGTLGTGATPVLVDPDARLGVEVSTTPLTVDAATAPIDAQEFTATTAVGFGDSVRVQSADIASGTLRLNLQSDVTLPVDVSLEIDAVRDPAGAPLRVGVAVGAGGDATRTVDLAGHRIDFGGSPGDSLRVVTRVTTPGSGGASVTVRADDAVQATMDSIHLVFDRVTGVVDPVRIDIDSTTTALDLPEDLESLHLARAALHLIFATSLGIPADFALHLEGTNADGAMVPLDVAATLPPATNGLEFVTVTFDETNSDLLRFLDNLPTSIAISGSATLGDGVTVGSVASDDSIAVRWAIEAPVTVQLEPQVIEVESTETDLVDALGDEIAARVRSAWIDAEVESSLPFGATATIAVATDSARVHTVPDFVLGPVEIPALPPDPSRPPGATVRSTSSVGIDGAQIDLVTTRPFFQGVRLSIPGTGDDFVTLRADDRVVIRGFLRVRATMGETP